VVVPGSGVVLSKRIKCSSMRSKYDSTLTDLKQRRAFWKKSLIVGRQEFG